MCEYTSVVTSQALLKTAHKQRRRAKDAYRGSKCSWSKARVLLQEAAVHSWETQALCWFITLLGLVTEIRTSMFQSDSWPLRFTHPTTNTHTHRCTLWGQTQAHQLLLSRISKKIQMKNVEREPHRLCHSIFKTDHTTHILYQFIVLPLWV